jgi:rRNA-processing protein FCF1
VVVLEGAARSGVPEEERRGLRVVHASGSGDDAIVALVGDAACERIRVAVVTADRALRERSRRAGGDVVSVRWLLDRL